MLNRELDADFDPSDFDHVALFDPERSGSRCACAHSARTPCSVGALELSVHFREGEEMRTEISAKFTPERIEDDLAESGLELVRWLTDSDGRFALTLSQPANRDRLAHTFDEHRHAHAAGDAHRLDSVGPIERLRSLMSVVMMRAPVIPKG